MKVDLLTSNHSGFIFARASQAAANMGGQPAAVAARSCSSRSPAQSSNRWNGRQLGIDEGQSLPLTRMKEGVGLEPRHSLGHALQLSQSKPIANVHHPALL